MSDYYGPLNNRCLPVAQLDFNKTYPHLYKDFPTPRLITYNVRSYSCTATKGKRKRRRARIRRNLQDVMKHADVVLVQETKIQTPDFYYMYAHDWYVFHNPANGCWNGADHADSVDSLDFKQTDTD